MTKDEMKNRISMALKDPILQQGFEIICKNLAELEKENEELKKINADGLSELNHINGELIIENEKLEKENAELKKLFIDFTEWRKRDEKNILKLTKKELREDNEIRRYCMENLSDREITHLDQLTKAKELLAKWVELFKPKGGNIPPTPIQIDTEQFLNSEVEK